jgi:hypothetical protein
MAQKIISRHPLGGLVLNKMRGQKKEVVLAHTDKAKEKKYMSGRLQNLLKQERLITLLNQMRD